MHNPEIISKMDLLFSGAVKGGVITYISRHIYKCLFRTLIKLVINYQTSLKFNNTQYKLHKLKIMIVIVF